MKLTATNDWKMFRMNYYWEMEVDAVPEQMLTSVDSVAWSKCSAANDSAPDTPKPAPNDDDPDLAQ